MAARNTVSSCTALSTATSERWHRIIGERASLKCVMKKGDADLVGGAVAQQLFLLARRRRDGVSESLTQWRNETGPVWDFLCRRKLMAAANAKGSRHRYGS